MALLPHAASLTLRVSARLHLDGSLRECRPRRLLLRQGALSVYTPARGGQSPVPRHLGALPQGLQSTCRSPGGHKEPYPLKNASCSLHTRPSQHCVSGAPIPPHMNPSPVHVALSLLDGGGILSRMRSPPRRKKGDTSPCALHIGADSTSKSKPQLNHLTTSPGEMFILKAVGLKPACTAQTQNQ